MNGYNGSALKKLAPILDLCKIKTCVTALHSREIQDLLTKASNAGSRFHATASEFLNLYDFFIAEERKQRNGELKILKTKKEYHKTQKIRESEGKADIQNPLVDKNKDAYTEEDAKALDAKGLKVLYI